MKLEITLHGHLPWYLEDRVSSLTLELPAGASLEELLISLNVPRSEVALVAMDGEQVGWNVDLHDQAKVELFPVIAGGGGSLPLKTIAQGLSYSTLTETCRTPSMPSGAGLKLIGTTLPGARSPTM